MMKAIEEVLTLEMRFGSRVPLYFGVGGLYPGSRMTLLWLALDSFVVCYCCSNTSLIISQMASHVIVMRDSLALSVLIQSTPNMDTSIGILLRVNQPRVSSKGSCYADGKLNAG